MRGLYADHVKRETEVAMAARLGAIKAASEALGHTTTATTEKHYLTPSTTSRDAEGPAAT